MERTPLSGTAALHIHDTSISSSNATTSARAICGNIFFTLNF
jgi:hypothetical protein